jgi:hypothetical protein
MTKRITQPISTRLERTSQQAQDALADIWLRLAKRMLANETRYGRIESQAKQAQVLNKDAGERILKIGEALQAELPMQQMAVEMLHNLQRGIVEVARIISKEGEILSQNASDSALAAADIVSASTEMARAVKEAQEGRYDMANMQTFTRFITDDPATIGAVLDEVDPAKFTQALKERDPATWQRLSEAFEVAKAGRND